MENKTKAFLMAVLGIITFTGIASFFGLLALEFQEPIFLNILFAILMVIFLVLAMGSIVFSHHHYSE